MSRRTLGVAALLTLTLLVVAVSGCTMVRQTGRLQNEAQTVDLEGAESVVANLRMEAGQLVVEGGADALLQADFTYNVAEWKPIVDYSVSDGRDELTIRQPQVQEISVGDYRYELSSDQPGAPFLAGAGEPGLAGVLGLD